MAMMRWLIVAAALVAAGTTAAENLASTRNELAPTGKLRVGILVGSLGPSTFYTVRDSTSEWPRGVTVGLAGAVARELGVAALPGSLRHPVSGRDPQEGDDDDRDSSFG